MDTICKPLLDSFVLLEKSFVNEIKMVGYLGQRILIVTRSDRVYGLGPLPDSWIYTDKFELREIPQLSKKKVERFIFGLEFVFILTENGEVFCWGENVYGMLGVGHENTVREPTIIQSFVGKKIIDVTCGLYHAVAMTSDQQVYYWGALHNSAGILSEPGREKTKAVGIAASEHAAFYLNSDGEVYGMGFLNNVEKYSIGNGYSHSYGLNDWTKIQTLSNITKIVCGKSHAMALDKDGALFVWGDNQKKQLSYQIYESPGIPTQMYSISEKITDLAASSKSDISVALTECCKIYVWGGRLGGGYFSKPCLTQLTSFEEVFSYLSDPVMTYRSISFSPTMVDKFLGTGTFEPVFDVQDDSDLTISVQEKTIHVHKVILKTRSKYFQAMFSNQWKESDKKILKIDEYSYDSYRSFLSYLYTGNIEVTPENVFELVTIADKYSDDILLSLLEKKLDNCEIPEDIVKILKDIMKLSSPNFEKFCEGVKKMVVSSVPGSSK